MEAGDDPPRRAWRVIRGLGRRLRAHSVRDVRQRRGPRTGGRISLNNKDDSSVIAFENDLFLGLRLVLNDIQSTEMLFGIIKDLDDTALLYNLEASRRLGEDWKLSVAGRFFTRIKPQDPQYDVRNDDYLQVELARYF